MKKLIFIILFFNPILMLGANLYSPLNINLDTGFSFKPSKLEINFAIAPSNEWHSTKWISTIQLIKPRLNYAIGFSFNFSKHFGVSSGLFLMNKIPAYLSPPKYPEYLIIPFFINYRYALTQKWEFMASTGILAGYLISPYIEKLANITPPFRWFLQNNEYYALNAGYGLRYNFGQQYFSGFKFNFSYQLNYGGQYIIVNFPSKFNSTAMDFYIGYKFSRNKFKKRVHD